MNVNKMNVNKMNSNMPAHPHSPMLYTRTVKDRSFAKDPAVVRFAGKYYMYFSCIPQLSPVSLGVGIAQSDNITDWTDIGEIPLTQECEKNGIGAPAAIVLDGKVHLFYQTYNNGAKDAICHAWSDDGINFEKNETNPIWHPSDSWCCGRAIDADVCVFGDRLMLYFATRDFDFKVQMVGGASAPLGSGYTHSDWTALSDAPIVYPSLDWERRCIEAPAVIEDDGKLYMFYGGSYNCEPQQIGCTVSADGVNFERLFDEPFLKPGAEGDFNASESGHPYVFRDDDNSCYLFYQGSPDHGKSWYLSVVRFVFRNGIPVLTEHVG